MKSEGLEAALYTNREEPFPCRRRATVLECGDWSPLLRRRLVAVELTCLLDHASVSALARAVDAPSQLHASRSSTATSRLDKAVTSHRTPQSCSFDCGSSSSPPVPSHAARDQPGRSGGGFGGSGGSGGSGGEGRGSATDTMFDSAVRFGAGIESTRRVTLRRRRIGSSSDAPVKNCATTYRALVTTVVASTVVAIQLAVSCQPVRVNQAFDVGQWCLRRHSRPSPADSAGSVSCQRGVNKAPSSAATASPDSAPRVGAVQGVGMVAPTRADPRTLELPSVLDDWLQRMRAVRAIIHH